MARGKRVLDLFRQAVTDAGGPQILKWLEKIALKGCPLHPEVIFLERAAGEGAGG